tara:strand:- start:678 stop:1529 length:852 start_codon:yes stop_codon:yes gene_type:complete
MSIAYSSIEEIKGDFELSEESNDSLRKALTRIKSTLHPDKHGGQFANKNDELKYHKLNAAIDFIDIEKSKSADLITISAVTELTKAITALVSTKAEDSSRENNLSIEIERSITSYTSKQKMPRIALTSVTVALTALWVFPNTVKEHPVLSNLIDFTSTTVNIIWFYALGFCVLYWIKTWRSEELTKSHRESLKTEFVQNKLFTNFLKSRNEEVFTMEDLVEYLLHDRQRRLSPIQMIFGVPHKVDLPLANVTAEVIIERALKNKAVSANSVGSISKTYKLNNG